MLIKYLAKKCFNLGFNYIQVLGYFGFLFTRENIDFIYRFHYWSRHLKDFKESADISTAGKNVFGLQSDQVTRNRPDGKCIPHNIVSLLCTVWPLYCFPCRCTFEFVYVYNEQKKTADRKNLPFSNIIIRQSIQINTR